MFASHQASVLITGGTDGIGQALAARFVASGARVMVTGRDEGRLADARHRYSDLLTVRSDIGIASDRESLADHIKREMPGLNVLINNAGIQRRVGLSEDTAPWNVRQQEIDVLLAGPVHLNDMLVPLMLSHGKPGLIVNVTSGGAYIPQPFAPVYAACKAALHSYTVTLRHALRGTPVRVMELVPPAVATGLAGPSATHGAPLDAFIDAVFPRIVAGIDTEVGYGPTATDAFRQAMVPYRAMFDSAAARFPVKGYGNG